MLIRFANANIHVQGNLSHFFTEKEFHCNDSSYIMHVKKKSFVNASQFCMTLGPGWMLSMPSSEEDIGCILTNIKRYTDFNKHTLWLGYHRPLNQIWSNLYGNALQWSNYEAKQVLKSDGAYGCTILLRTNPELMWRAIACKDEDKRPFMCQNCEHRGHVKRMDKYSQVTNVFDFGHV